MAPKRETEPSNYMQTLTRYLSNIMNSVLLGLPTEIKELIYFDALSHATTMILVRFHDPVSDALYSDNAITVSAFVIRCEADQS